MAGVRYLYLADSRRAGPWGAASGSSIGRTQAATGRLTDWTGSGAKATAIPQSGHTTASCAVSTAAGPSHQGHSIVDK